MLNLAFFLFFLFVSKGFFFLFTDGRLSRFSWRRTGGRGGEGPRRYDRYSGAAA